MTILFITENKEWIPFLVQKSKRKEIIPMIKIKKLTTTATIPTKGSKYSAGYDLYADNQNEIYVLPHTTVKIHTGLAFMLPENTAGFIFARSGVATKRGLRPANAVGVVDSDYRGEVIVALHNDTNDLQIILPYERIAQLVVMPYCLDKLQEVDELDKTERGTGGFGSTGTN